MGIVKQCFKSRELQLHDTFQREIRSRIVNVSLTDASWAHTSLSVRWEGIEVWSKGAGVLSTTDPAPSAFNSIVPPGVALDFIHSITNYNRLARAEQKR